MCAEHSYEDYMVSQSLRYYDMEGFQAAYVEMMKRPVAARIEHTTGYIELTSIGYYRSEVTLHLARCLWNNSPHVVYADDGAKLDPYTICLLWGGSTPDRIGAFNPNDAFHVTHLRTPGQQLGEYKQERNKRVNAPRHWLHGKKLCDDPSNHFTERA